MSYILHHTVLWKCWWDLLALVILVGVCVYAYIKLKKQKEQVEELNKRLEANAAATAVEAAADTAADKT